MAGRFGGWCRRRVVEADLRDLDTVCGLGRLTWSGYLEDRSGWRRYWVGAAVVEGLVFVGLVGAMLAFPWMRPGVDGPELGWWVFTLPIAGGCVWMLLLVQSSLRGMVRGLRDPVRPSD